MIYNVTSSCNCKNSSVLNGLNNMAYYNKTTDEYYSGGPFTLTKPDESIFYGIPTIEELIEWGFKEYIPPVEEYEEEPIETDEDEIIAEEALDIIVNG